MMLAATYGHLGQQTAAQEALAKYRSLSPLPPSDFIQLWASSTTAEGFKLPLDGLAVAEGDGSP
jgi:hypothetical protein